MLVYTLSFVPFQAAGTATAQVVHTQQRAVPAAAAPAEVVTIATSQGIRAVTPVTASAVVSTSLPQVQSQTRTLGAPGTARCIRVTAFVSINSGAVSLYTGSQT